MRNFSLVLFAVISALAIPVIAQAAQNPAYVYCRAMGYDYMQASSGDGQCQIPGSGEKFDDWDFYKGKAGQRYSYCVLHGYEIRTIVSEKICPPTSLDGECGVCIVNNKAVSIAELMKLNFAEDVCGDGVCSPLEDYASCSKDCHSGADDGVCDEMPDGKCDPDCTQVVTYAGAVPGPDPDCHLSEAVPGKKNLSARVYDFRNMLALFVALVLIVAGVVYYRKNKNSQS